MEGGGGGGRTKLELKLSYLARYSSCKTGPYWVNARFGQPATRSLEIFGLYFGSLKKLASSSGLFIKTKYAFAKYKETAIKANTTLSLKIKL